MADAMTLYRFPNDQLSKWHDLARPDHDELLEDAEDTPTPRHVNTLMGEIPPYPHDPELNDRLNFKQKEEAKKQFDDDYPEQKVFCLKDLQRLYDSYAQHDPRIKEFVEKITEMVRVGDTESLLYSFQVCELEDSEFGTARIAVLAFDTE